MLVCDTKGRVGILFGKDAVDQLGCWEDFANRCVHKTADSSTGNRKTVQIPAGKSVQNIHTASFQGRTMTFMNTFDKYSAFYTILAHFETNRCIIRVRNTKGSALSFGLL